MLRKPTRETRFGSSNAFEADDSQDFVQEYEPTDDQSPVDTTGDARGVDLAPRDMRTQSVIDANTVVDGRFEAGQDLIILGSVSGEIVCRGLLTIERDATAKARIESRDGQIRGRLEGDVVCSGRLVVAASANVTGTLKAAALVVEEGASIRGTVETASVSGGELSLPSSVKPATSRKAEPAAPGDAGNVGAGASGSRWNRTTRETPNFALVSSEEQRTSLGGN